MNTIAWATNPSTLVRLDRLSCMMLVLVGWVGGAIALYSRRYLRGDPGISRYFRWFSLILAAVVCLVITRNLAVIAVAWLVTSLGLHSLLVFYPERAAAVTAAHKKFLVSRLADLALGACLALVYRSVGSFDLDRIDAWVVSHPGLSPSMHVAALLVVLAVALRSAQLPFHGWLMQVMEAPTPVSALLHAGVVNIGGFVLIRLSPWIGRAPAAQAALVFLGLATCILAALVMTTRVSVKVSLAWSTCAQMGFMLVECGLGAWHLALLHLVAHSLYKAHAFLSAGGAVRQWEQASRTRPSVVASVGVKVGVAVAFLVMHRIAGWWFPGGSAPTWLWVIAALGMLALFVARRLLQVRPGSRFVRALYPWLFAGFYVDERFTKVAFWFWPPPLVRPEQPAGIGGRRCARAAEA